MEAAGKLSKPVIQEDLQKRVAEAAVDVIIQSPPEEKKRIGQQIIDLVHSDKISWGELPDVLKKYNLSPEEFATKIKRYILDRWPDPPAPFGRGSERAKRNRKKSRGPENSGRDHKRASRPFGWDKFMIGLKNLESTRRGFLVSQLATTMRNVTSRLAGSQSEPWTMPFRVQSGQRSAEKETSCRSRRRSR